MRNLIECKKCLYKEDHPFGITFKDGICSGCITHAEKDNLDWVPIKDSLLSLIYKYKKLSKSHYDCLITVKGDAEDYFVVSKVLEMDLKPPICDRSKIAVWFAFFGETKAQPTYRKICASRDQKYLEILKSLVEEIVTDGKYIGINPGVISSTLSSLTDGIWLSCLISPKSFSRTESLLAIQSYLRATFPNHYPR